MSRQIRATRSRTRAASLARAASFEQASLARAASFEQDYDDLDGAGPSGANPPVRPLTPPLVASSQAEVGDSDWEIEADDSFDDRSYEPPRPPANSTGLHTLSDSDTTTDGSESELDDMDYVRVHDSTVDSVLDSDVPLASRFARLAQVNAPGTDRFTWRYSQDAYVRRNAFSGV